MKKLKDNIGNVIMFIGEMIIGILLLIKPIEFTKTIIIGVGLITLIIGVINIIKYFKTDIIDAIKEQSLSIGLIFTLLGIFCVFN